MINSVPYFPNPHTSGGVECGEHSDTLTISRLATLLANGVRIHPGESFPNGWDELPEGRRRRYAEARPNQIRAARRLARLSPR